MKNFDTIVACTAVALALSGACLADDATFGSAKWIGPNRITQPDYDFGDAKWIGAVDAQGEKEVVFERTFTIDGVPDMAELVIAARGRYNVTVNGLRRWAGAKRDIVPVGYFHDWRYAKFIDAAPALRAGTNTIRFAVRPDGKEPPAALMSLTLPGGRRIVTDSSWTNSRVLGGPRSVAWGKSMVFRREVNSPAFEKTVKIGGDILSARLAITGLGYYEASINGNRVGEKRLDPIPTDYDARVNYSVYDVTEHLRKGENTLKVLLGHGWYDVRAIATWNWDMAPWRAAPRMIANLEVTMKDGSKAEFPSDATWRQVESPVGFDCIREGEVIGARNRRAVDLAAKAVFAETVEPPRGRLVPETTPPTVVRQLIPARRVDRIGDWWRIDFGENVAGVMRFRFADAVAGRVVTFRYDERDGETADPPFINQYGKQDSGAPGDARHIDAHFGWTASHDVLPGSVFQCDRYVTRGVVGEVYEPRFTYSGFQYVFVKGLGRAPQVGEAVAEVLHTDFRKIGSFACSDETFNTLVRMTDRAYKSNFANGFPTDCPHREKNGWSADAALASELAMYDYENTDAYVAWLREVAGTQRADGMIAEIIPTSGWGYAAYVDWDAIMAILPENIYRYRGEVKPLLDMYPTLSRYLDRVAIPSLKDGICSRARGDWVTAGSLPDSGIVGTCYFKLMAEAAAFSARLLGESEAAERYSKFATAAREAFNRKYARGNGFYGDERGRQATQAMALEFGMVPHGERAAAERQLVSAVQKADGHLDFGLHGIKWVPRALSKAGRSDLVFAMLTNPTAPSPVDWVKRGGTSLWEDWKNGFSRNHIMFGDFVCWAYQYLAGIRLAEEEDETSALPRMTGRGFEQVVIEPHFIGALAWAKGSVETPHGTLSSDWRREGKEIELTVTLPPQTEAEIRLPPSAGTRTVRCSSAGTHCFRFAME